MTAEQEKNRLERIAKFIKDGKITQWGAEAHIKLLLSELRHAFPEIADDAHKAQRIAFADSLSANGLGGNASQFRQWLENPKGANLLKAAPKDAPLDSRYSDV